VTAIFGACGTALGASRAYYTSQESVEDLDAVRQALGGTPLSLFAVSYGGRVAGMYAHEHPEGVARMVLDSPTPLGGSGALYSDRLRALRRVLDEGICGAGACDAFSSDVYADLTRLVERLHRGALHTRIFDDAGRLQKATVTEKGLLRLLLGLDLAPATRKLSPAAISAAAAGNAAPLARLTHSLQDEVSGSAFVDSPASLASTSTHERRAKRPPPSASEISEALFAATYCVENELPWSPDSAPASRSATLKSWLAGEPAGITAPFRLSTVVSGSPVKLCLGWPATPPAPPPPTGVSATPTLILSGDDDLRTPYEQDVTVAAGYSNVQLLRIPGIGHSTVTADTTGCAEHAMIAFLATGQAPVSCSPPPEPLALALPPASLDAVAPAPSRSRLAGRVAAAAAITLEDLLGQTNFSGGGLRGGFWKIEGLKPRLMLHHTVDVPGVILNGAIALGGTTQPDLSGHIALQGRVQGTLILKGRTLSGRLNGARVHAQINE
jgi:pimeloyl-ACP methyl ester carboxylesterase